MRQHDILITPRGHVDIAAVIQQLSCKNVAADDRQACANARSRIACIAKQDNPNILQLGCSDTPEEGTIEVLALTYTLQRLWRQLPCVIELLLHQLHVTLVAVPYRFMEFLSRLELPVGRY